MADFLFKFRIALVVLTMSPSPTSSHLVVDFFLRHQRWNVLTFFIWQLGYWLRSTSLSRCRDFEIYFNFQNVRSFVESQKKKNTLLLNGKCDRVARMKWKLIKRYLVNTATAMMTTMLCYLRRKILIRNISFFYAESVYVSCAKSQLCRVVWCIAVGKERPNEKRKKKFVWKMRWNILALGQRGGSVITMLLWWNIFWGLIIFHSDGDTKFSQETEKNITDNQADDMGDVSIWKQIVKHESEMRWWKINKRRDN